MWEIKYSHLNAKKTKKKWQTSEQPSISKKEICFQSNAPFLEVFTHSYILFIYFKCANAGSLKFGSKPAVKNKYGWFQNNEKKKKLKLFYTILQFSINNFELNLFFSNSEHIKSRICFHFFLLFPVSDFNLIS